MSFQTLDINKDGLTYCIDAVTHDGEKYEGLLSEDTEGWLLEEVTRAKPAALCLCNRIGRRKSWVTALADALVIIAKATGAQV